MFDSELSFFNDFSSSLHKAINSGSNSIWGAISIATVQYARAAVEGGINQIRRKIGSTSGKALSNISPYVAITRINELRIMKGETFDLTRLIRLAEELNTAYANEC